MGMGISLSKQFVLRLVWLLIIASAFLLVQTATAAHVHNDEIDLEPEATCIICLLSSQSDDIDLPTLLAIPDGANPGTWTLSIVIEQLSSSPFKARARAPPYS